VGGIPESTILTVVGTHGDFPCTRKLVQRAWTAAEKISEVVVAWYYFHDAGAVTSERDLQKLMGSQFAVYLLECIRPGLPEKVLKSGLTNVLARGFPGNREEAPAAMLFGGPSGASNLFPGIWGRKVRHCITNARKGTEWAWASLMGLKKAFSLAEPVTKEFVEDTIDGLVETLTTDTPPPAVPVSAVRKIRLAAKKLLFRQHTLTAPIPSQKATCFSGQRAGGGYADLVPRSAIAAEATSQAARQAKLAQVEALLGPAPLCDGGLGSGVCRHKEGPLGLFSPLSFLSEDRTITIGDWRVKFEDREPALLRCLCDEPGLAVLPLDCQNVYQSPFGLVLREPFLHHRTTRVLDISEESSLWYAGLVADALEARPLAVPKGIIEPLKVRPITTENAAIQTALRPVQKVLSRSLGQYECFAYTRMPVDKERSDLEPLKRLFLKCREADGLLLSGDYSAATDGLSKHWSEVSWEACFDRLGLPDCFLPLGLRGLTRHLICHEGVELEQTNGQLMGSIISFPILCLVNLVVSWEALETLWGRALGWDELPDYLQINGDDCLLVVPNRDDALSVWTDVIATAGFKPSQGKCYLSPTHGGINSRFFSLNQEEELVRGRFVNYPLLRGIIAKGGGGVAQPLELGPNWEKLSEELPVGLEEQAETLFRRWNKESLTRIPNVSWRMPVHLGGLGLPFGDPEPQIGGLIAAALLDRDAPLPDKLRADYTRVVEGMWGLPWSMDLLGSIRTAVGVEYTTEFRHPALVGPLKGPAGVDRKLAQMHVGVFPECKERRDRERIFKRLHRKLFLHAKKAGFKPASVATALAAARPVAVPVVDLIIADKVPISFLSYFELDICPNKEEADKGWQTFIEAEAPAAAQEWASWADEEGPDEEVEEFPERGICRVRDGQSRGYSQIVCHRCGANQIPRARYSVERARPPPIALGRSCQC
jgi:hypothetical protein